MAFGGDFVGTANDPRIVGRAILAELCEEFFEARVQLAIVAVAVKIEREIAGGRHGIVYLLRRLRERSAEARKLAIWRGCTPLGFCESDTLQKNLKSFVLIHFCK